MRNTESSIRNTGKDSIAHLRRIGASRLRDIGVESAALDADLLSGAALGRTREYLFAHGEEPVPASARKRFERLLARRLAHEPMATILGTKEFYGLEFAVNRHVLIPRPKTEAIVEQAKAILEKQNNPPRSSPGSSPGQALPKRGGGSTLVIDVGTGSGILAITLKKSFPEVAVLAIDASARALRVARGNAVKHGFRAVDYGRGAVDGDAVAFLQSDLLSKVREVSHANILILANLPYVPTREIATLEKDVKEYEPVKALDGGEDGLDLFRRLARQVRRKFPTQKVEVLWECEENQEAAVRELFAQK